MWFRATRYGLVAMQAGKVIRNGDDLVVEPGSSRHSFFTPLEDLARALAQRLIDFFPRKTLLLFSI